MKENKSFPSKYINYAALIMGAVYLVFAITKIPAIFSSLGLLAAWIFIGFIFCFVSRIFMFLGPAVFGVSLLLSSAGGKTHGFNRGMKARIL